MKEIITSIKEKLDMAERAQRVLPDEQKKRVVARLKQIDDDTRSLILFCLAISKR